MEIYYLLWNILSESLISLCVTSSKAITRKLKYYNTVSNYKQNKRFQVYVGLWFKKANDRIGN